MVSSLRRINYVYKLSKEFIEKYCQDEAILFDNIWEIYEPELNRLMDLPPEKWHFKIPKYKLMGALGFSDPNQMPDLVTPKIIQVIFAALFQLKKLQVVSSIKTVEVTIEKCAEDLPGSLRSQTVSYFAPLIFKDIGKVSIEIKEQYEKKIEENNRTIAYARVWTPKTPTPKIGEAISEEDYEDIWGRREITPLLIVKSGEIKYIYIYGKTKFLSPRRFDLLEYFLKNRGQGGDIINMLDKVWEKKENAKMLRQELRKGKMGQKVDSDLIREETSNITGTIAKLNKFLLKYLEVEIRSDRKGQYGFSNFIEYNLIEVT